MFPLLICAAICSPVTSAVLGGLIGQTEMVPVPILDTIDQGEYTVGPGDVFWFSVQGGLPIEMTGLEESSFAYLTVTPDGFLVVPTVGAYFVSGRVLADAVDIVEAGFASRFPGLRASAGLAQVRRARVVVTGQVGIPGMAIINGSDRLTDLLAAAGGLEQAGSWTRIQMIHADGDTTEVDITPFLVDGLTAYNPIVGIGDRVNVPRAERFVSMEGAFQPNPLYSVSRSMPSDAIPWSGSISGMLEYIPGETVSRFVTRVGGTMSWADRESCRILRADGGGQVTVIPAPLDDLATDPVLLPGDRVVCPGTPPLVAVSGYVEIPGVFPFIAGMDAFHYVSMAGGVSREGSSGGSRVVLPDGTRWRLDELDDIPAGATITVPRSVLVWWQDPLLILTSVATIVIAWKSLD